MHCFSMQLAAAPTAAGESAADVRIFDQIGESWFSQGVTAKAFAEQLDALDVDVVRLSINSPGGSAWEGIAMMNTLRRHRARIEVTVEGIAASAASVVAMAGDHITMNRGAELMIHDAWGGAMGNSDELVKYAAALGKLSDSIAGIYAARAGGTAEQWRDAMRAETWYAADEAVVAGLADAWADAPAAAASFDLDAFGYRGRPRELGAAAIATTTPTLAPAAVVTEAADAAEQETAQMSTLTAPNTAGVPAATIEKALIADTYAPDARDVFSAIADFRSGDGTARAAAETMLAALTDIKTSGAGEMPTDGGVIQPDWLGKLFQGKRYQRKYWSLLKAGTQISLGGKKGYTLTRGTSGAPVAHYTTDWAGNKADINSGTGFTAAISSTLARYAYGNDIAREFFDLPGGMELIEAFFELLREDYLVWSDGKALAAVVSAAGAKVAPDAYPADISDAHGVIAQGMVEITDLVNPSFSILNKTGFKELLYSPKDKIPEYIAFGVGTIGEGSAEGKVQVRWAPDAIFTAAGITTGTAAITGGREAVEVDELGEVPLTVDALAIAKGGVDRAIHGYAQTFIPYADGVVLVGA